MQEFSDSKLISSLTTDTLTSTGSSSSNITDLSLIVHQSDTMSSQFFESIIYSFIFINDNSPRDLEIDKKSSKQSEYLIEVRYLMPETYRLVDEFIPFFQNRVEEIQIEKKWEDSKNLESILKKLEDAGNRSPEIFQPEPLRFFIFVIESFDNPILLDILNKHNQITISPLVIQYWLRIAQIKRNEFDLTSQLLQMHKSLFSECMKNCTVYLSKSIPNDTRICLGNLIVLMGGSIADQFGLSVTHAVIEKSDTINNGIINQGSVDLSNSQPKPRLSCSSSDKQVNAAYFFGIPIVTIDWVEIAWKNLQLQYKPASSNDFILYYCSQLHIPIKPILDSFIIGIILSVYSKEEIEKFFNKISSINNVIVRFGGKFIQNVTNFEFQKIDLIIHLDIGSIKPNQEHGLDEINQIDQTILDRYQNNAHLQMVQSRRNKPIPLVKVKWLLDTIINLKVQKLTPYEIKISDANRSPAIIPAQSTSASSSLSLTKLSDQESATNWIDLN